MLSRPPASLASAISRSALWSSVSARREDLGDPLLGDHRGEPVAAQQQHVAGSHRIAEGVDLDVGSGPSARVMIDRCGCSAACSSVSLPCRRARRRANGPCVSALQRAVAEQIRAAVADVGDRHVRVVEQRRGERRAHAGALVLGARHLVDPPVRLLHADREPLLGRAVVRQALGKRLDRDLRGDLAGLRSPHPVGDDEHAADARARSPRFHGAVARCRSSESSRRRGAWSAASVVHCR